MIIAVDPGVRGSISCLFESVDFYDVWDVPVFKVQTGRKTKKGNLVTRNYVQYYRDM